jgi:hypothetical protein
VNQITYRTRVIARKIVAVENKIVVAETVLGPFEDIALFENATMRKTIGNERKQAGAPDPKRIMKHIRQGRNTAVPITPN